MTETRTQLVAFLNILVDHGYVIVFGGLEEGQRIELRIFMPRSFGAPAR